MEVPEAVRPGGCRRRDRRRRRLGHGGRRRHRGWGRRSGHRRRRVLELGHGDGDRLPVGVDEDPALPGLLARRAGAHRMLAGIDGDSRADQRVGDHGAVAPDLHRVPAHDGEDGELGQLRLQRGRVGAGGVLPLGLPVLLGEVGRLEEVGPGARRLAALLLAVGEVEERAQPGIEVLALLQLGAGLGVALVGDEAARVVEERLRGGALVGRGVGAGRGGRRHGEGQRERGEAREEEARAAMVHAHGGVEEGKVTA